MIWFYVQLRSVSCSDATLQFESKAYEKRKSADIKKNSKNVRDLEE